MHAHLLECALPVFAAQGVKASIDDVIVAAGVSRGTFYNYFRTNLEVLKALGDALARELFELVEATVLEYDDPVQRVGVGIRLYLRATRENQTFGAFLWRTAFEAATTRTVLHSSLPKHLAEAIATGRLALQSVEAGVDAAAGVVLAGAFAFSTRKAGRAYADQLARSAMLALGASRKDVEKVMALPLPRMNPPEGSLLARIGLRAAPPRASRSATL